VEKGFDAAFTEASGEASKQVFAGTVSALDRPTIVYVKARSVNKTRLC
jgi:hypothetical protein